jgi:aspartate carbamoyltransferase catalytic subunit
VNAPAAAGYDASGPTAAGWHHRHLLDVADLSTAEVELVCSTALEMAAVHAAGEKRTTLRGRRVTILMYEASTRTRVSFELAGRGLSADVVNVAAAGSSVAKGESLVDTVRTIEALGADVLVIRHARSGAAELAARHFAGHVVNAGDGWHAHPSQALLDLYTLREALPGDGLRGRKVVILGDVLHSRVARSNVWTLTGAGVDLWLCGPATLLRGFEAWAAALPDSRRLTVTTDVDEALRDADAVICLRLQRERMASGLLPSLSEYTARYGLTAERLAACRPEVVVLHPGPMNEGVEIAPDVANGPSSRIARQVTNGVAVRMAVLWSLLGSGGSIA